MAAAPAGRVAVLGGLAALAVLLSPAPARALSDRDTTIWGGFGDRPGQLFDPRGIAPSPDGQSVYVADTGNDRVVQFTSEGIFIRAFGGRGSGNAQFHDPVAVATDRAGVVYVADHGNGRVQRFNSTGRFLGAWDSPAVVGVATDRAGRVFTLSSFLNLVAARGPDGTSLAGWQAFPVAFSQEGYAEQRWAPASIATDRDGNVYVGATRSIFYATCNPGSNDARENPVERVGVVRKFSPSGALLAEGSAYPGPSSCYHGITDRVVDGVAVNPVRNSTYLAQTLSDEARILDRDLRGTGPGGYPDRLGRPFYPDYTSYVVSSLDGLAFDCRANLYATSRLSHLVIKYRVVGPLPFAPDCVRPAFRRTGPASLVLGEVSIAARVARSGARLVGGSTAARMTVGCRGGGRTCSGRLELADPLGVALARARRFRIAAGDSKTLTIPLLRRGRQKLAGLGRLAVVAVARVTGGRRTRRALLRSPSVLTLGCPSGAGFGAPLTVSGSIVPARAGGPIEVAFSSPTGPSSVLARPDALGRFTASVPAGVAGLWSLSASFAGSRAFAPSAARLCTTPVPAAPPGPQQASTLSLSCPPTAALDESMTFFGAIAPPHQGATVTITYTQPDSTKLTHTPVTDDRGRFSDTFSTQMAGTWHAQASWAGDAGHLGASSAGCDVPVG